MPPPDYAAYRKVVPNSGIAKTSVMAPANVAAAADLDPMVQQYLAEQRAVREPWSSYLPRVGTNLYNAGKSLLTEGIAPSAIVQGAVETAGKATDLMSGAIPAWDPYTSMPNPAAVEATADIAGEMTLGAGAIPAEANALRTGATARQAGKPATVIADVPRPKAPRDNIGFYSRAQEALLASDQTSGTVQQFVAYLKKSGVKQPEIEALLKNYGPDEKVTTKQLVNTLAAEEVMVRDEITDAFRDDSVNMPGGTNYRMLNIAWSNPDATYGMVPYTYSPHNLPDNTLVHARLKDDVYKDPNTGTAKKVLRVEELQSDWAQQGRGKWALPADPKRIKMENIPLEKFEEEYVKRRKKDIEQRNLDEADVRKLAQTYIGQARAANSDKITMYRVTGVLSDSWDVLSAVQDPFTPEELLQETRDTFGEELKTDGPAALAMTPVQEMLFNEQFGQAPAPYVTQGSSGVVPLATKRLLLEAAKNGQEEIVFAPGRVHAQRWGKNDKKIAEGLKSFYDDVLPKELQDVAKDVNKVTGIKGLEITREPRPFVPAESSRPKKWYDDNLYTWFDNIPDQQRTDLGFAPPAVGDLVSTVAHADKMTALNNVNSRLSYKLGQGESIETALGDLDSSLQQEKELRLRLASRHDKLIEALENMPYDQMTTKMQENLQSIYNQRAQYLNQAEQIQLQRDVLPKALGIYKAWAKETGGGGNGEALVVKLSPDLREYLKKNGLPRFAKGGIVDLALHGAWA